MIEIYPISLFIITGLTWLMLFIQSHRLFYKFRKKYPDTAKRDIPYAFEFVRHNEKFLYFFRKKCLKVLSEDVELLMLRRQVVILTWASLIVPITGFFYL